jgi:peptidoglycan hydrolase-like protein with peptidoglycan-binding domain
MFGDGLRILVLLFLTISAFAKPIAANDVFIAQELLTKLGYTPGPIDGSYGAKTKYALENFYASQNKKFDGELSSNEITSLKTYTAV